MKYGFAVAAVVSSFFLVDCSPKQTNGPVDFAHQKSDLVADDAVVYGKLPNGVRYAVMQNDTPTKTAALRVRFGTGSLNESDLQQGLAHFLEHMAFNGSKNIPEGEMIKRLERFGLAFGADTNAYTSFDETVYTLDLPEVSEEILDETLMIMRETAKNLSLEQEAIERERGVVQAEKRRGDSAGARASRASLKFFTEGSRISDRLPIGTDETLSSMGADLFRDYYQAYYRPENTFIVLVGDIETDYATTKIAEFFNDWQAVGEARESQDAGITPARGSDTGYFTDPEIQTRITLATIKPYMEKEDTVANRKKSFIDGLGNRILNRRLSSLARKADADFIGGGAGYSYSQKTAEIMSLSMSSRPENWKKALIVGEHELRKALEFGFTQAELDEQLANSRKSLQVSVQTAETRRTGSLASGILSGFSNESVFSHPASALERFETYVDDITVDDVWSRFKEQWSALDEPLLYLQTSEIIENPEKTIQNAYAESRAIDVEANEANKGGVFAYTDFGKPGNIVNTEYIEDIDAHLITFENNVLLNFKKTDFAKDQISISISIGDGGFSMPKKSAALQFLASNVMSAGGLEAHSADDIQRLLAGKAVGVGFGIGAQSFSISGGTVPSDLEHQFNLMAAQLTAPGYRQEAKARYDKYIESWYPTLDSTPGGVASRDVSRILHSNDARYGIPNQAELLAEDIETIKNWIGPQLAEGQIEIGVVGDIDKDRVIEQVARTFGALPKRELGHKTYPDMMQLSFPKAPQKPITLTHSGDANRALLRVYWPAPDGTDTMRNRRLSILRSIFGNRLTDVIREEEGAAYSPSAGRNGSRFYKNYGYMSASLGLTPEKVPEMIKKLDEVAADFQSTNISDDEFERAIKPVLENLDSSLESNGYWMRVISNAQTDTWDIDNFRTREKAFQNMTLEDIKPLAAEIFRADNAVRIQILPEK
jgi:zinc protease